MAQNVCLMKMQIWPAAMLGWSFNKLHCAEVLLSFCGAWQSFIACIEVASVIAHLEEKKKKLPIAFHIEVKDEWMKVVVEKFVQQSSDFLPLLEFLKGSVLCVCICVCVAPHLASPLVKDLP